MREDHLFGQTKAGQKALVIGIGRLSFQLRLGVNHLGAVHRAGADAHQDTVKGAHPFPESNLHKKSVLGRHMPACQNNQLRAANKLARLVLISAIQHGILAKLQTQRFQVRSDRLRKTVRLLVTIRVRADKKHLARGRNAGSNPVGKAIGGVNAAPVRKEGTAG